jgi:hypothetical protein
MSKPSRWWLVKNVSGLITSGFHQVEVFILSLLALHRLRMYRPLKFADFWMGYVFHVFGSTKYKADIFFLSSDQLCSLIFTLSNIYFIICAYANQFRPTVWQQCDCGTGAGWATPFILAILPLVLRLVQSVRRYADLKSNIHLINVSQLLVAPQEAKQSFIFLYT